MLLFYSRNRFVELLFEKLKAIQGCSGEIEIAVRDESSVAVRF